MGKLDYYFLLNLNKMVSSKSEEYQTLFFKRIHQMNEYLNETGTTFHSLDTAVLMMVELDLYFKNEENKNVHN